MTYTERIAEAEARIAAEMTAAGLDATNARMFAEREINEDEAKAERKLEGRVS